MASEQFVLVPYLGYDPTYSAFMEHGLPIVGGTHKIASKLDNSDWEAYPVYYCKTTDTTSPFYANGLYLSQQQSHYMTIVSRVISSGTSPMLQVSRSYTVGQVGIFLDYNTSNYSNYFNIDAQITPFASVNDAAIAFINMFPSDYVNITYVGNGCDLYGPSYVMGGTGIIVPVTLPIGTTLSANSISVTKNGTLIDFNYNPQTKQIAFTAI